jgi:hypothetical protein
VREAESAIRGDRREIIVALLVIGNFRIALHAQAQ